MVKNDVIIGYCHLDRSLNPRYTSPLIPWPSRSCRVAPSQKNSCFGRRHASTKLGPLIMTYQIKPCAASSMKTYKDRLGGYRLIYLKFQPYFLSNICRNCCGETIDHYQQLPEVLFLFLHFALNKSLGSHYIQCWERPNR